MPSAAGEQMSTNQPRLASLLEQASRNIHTLRDQRCGAAHGPPRAQSRRGRRHGLRDQAFPPSPGPAGRTSTAATAEAGARNPRQRTAAENLPPPPPMMEDGWRGAEG